MQIPEIVDTILEYIPTIDFDKTDDEVSLFETTIRYLGGMLSGISQNVSRVKVVSDFT